MCFGCTPCGQKLWSFILGVVVLGFAVVVGVGWWAVEQKIKEV